MGWGDGGGVKKDKQQPNYTVLQMFKELGIKHKASNNNSIQSNLFHSRLVPSSGRVQGGGIADPLLDQQLRDGPGNQITDQRRKHAPLYSEGSVSLKSFTD